MAFSDDSVDNQGSYAVFVYKDYVIVDDGSCLSDKNMYQIIGYCQFHGIEYKINKWKDRKGVNKMSDLLLKTQQELHENTTKWNRVVEKIKEINFKKYETNQTIGFIIDDIVKGEFIGEEKKEDESSWAKEIDRSDMREWDKPNESEVL